MQLAAACTVGLAAAVSLGGGAELTAQTPAQNGLYAEIHTSKGVIVARLEPDLTPMTVANFVGLAEGTIANAAFDPARPFFDGSAFHRVVPGHVIQAGIPASDRADAPGYSFPNEIHAGLSHDHAGALGMANAGPHTNAGQFYITLDDRSYLDGDYIVFGDVVDGMDVVMRIVQGDVVDSVRIVRVGAKAETFRPTTVSFQERVRAAARRVAMQAASKRRAEQEWIADNWPNASGAAGGVATVRLAEATGEPLGSGPRRVRYMGTEVRYLESLLGYSGPALELTPFGSGADGAPGYFDPARAFPFIPGESTINAGLDQVIADMMPGERRVAIVPAELGYGRSGFYAPETPGEPRFVISPNTMLVYEVEVLRNERASGGAVQDSTREPG